MSNGGRSRRVREIDFSNLSDKLIFIPLGGSSEIGMNLNLYHLNGKWMMIDCGIGFADENIPGVDIITPSVEFLIKNKIRISGAVITHIHEDHIGGLPYLWPYLKCPLYLTPIAKEFLASKLHDRGINIEDCKIVDIGPQNSRFSIADFDLEIIGITHSVPEMKMVNIKTKFGNIVHTGDWKLDDSPVVGDKTDIARLKELGKEGVHSIVCDSTNVFSDGWSGSEGDLEKSLFKIAKPCSGKIVITTFASNIARIKTICDVAKKLGRHVVLCGFALSRITRIAKKIGYLLDESYEFIDPRDASGYAGSELLILSTGCQGEPMAAMRKIAFEKHPYVSIQEGDTVIFSSKIIPGNEKRIYALFNQLTERDIEIITERDHKVHVSGHPNRDELKKMYSILKPRFAIPVHGEPYHIAEHVEFAKTLGTEGQARVKNGDVVMIEANSVEKVGTVQSGHMCIDGKVLRDARSCVLRDRLKISISGVVYCVIVCKANNGDLVVEPVISMPGLVDEFEDKRIFERMTGLVNGYIDSNIKNNGFRGHERDFINKVENFITRLFEKELDKTPLVEIVLRTV